MQVKNQICTERSTEDPEQDDNQKKTSCFSNIKIFLVSECALMLAQGTVGAYLVSFHTVIIYSNLLTENVVFTGTYSSLLGINDYTVIRSSVDFTRLGNV